MPNRARLERRVSGGVKCHQAALQYGKSRLNESRNRQSFDWVEQQEAKRVEREN